MLGGLVRHLFTAPFLGVFLFCVGPAGTWSASKYIYYGDLVDETVIKYAVCLNFSGSQKDYQYSRVFLSYAFGQGRGGGVGEAG